MTIFAMVWLWSLIRGGNNSGVLVLRLFVFVGQPFAIGCSKCLKMVKTGLQSRHTPKIAVLMNRGKYHCALKYFMPHHTKMLALTSCELFLCQFFYCTVSLVLIIML